MAGSKIALEEKYHHFNTLLEVRVDDLFSFFSKGISVDKSVEEVYVEECANHLPHVKGVLFMLTGSRKEGSWFTRFFKSGDGRPIILESDLMVTFEGQTLSIEEQNCLIPCDELGYVKLKYPRENWLDCFAENEEDVFKITVDNKIYISADKCREWCIKIAEACNPSKDYRNLPEQGVGLFENIGKFVFKLFQNTGQYTKTGPAITLFAGSGTADFMNMAFAELISLGETSYCYENIDLLIKCYKQCLEINNIVKQLVEEILKMNVEICSETGVVSISEDLLVGQEKMDVHLKSNYMKLLNLYKTILSDVQKLKENKDFIFVQKIGSGMKVLDEFNDESNIFQYLLDLLSQVLAVTRAIEQDAIVTLVVQEGIKCFNNTPVCRDLLANMQYETDFVFAISCKFWPSIAKEWLTRERPSGFPNQKMITHIADKGVHIVPKTYPDGDPNLCWRYSFSAAESLLAESRSPEQQLVYLILKSIYFDHLLYEHDGEKVSSYCLKTMMMWACEKYNHDFWNFENIPTCVLSVLDDYIKAVSDGFLPHYFIPDMNLLGQNTTEVIAKVLKRAEEVKLAPLNYPPFEKIEQLNSVITYIKDIRTMLRNFQKYMKLHFTEGAGLSTNDLYRYFGSVSQYVQSIFKPTPIRETTDGLLNLITGKKPPASEKELPFEFEPLFGVHKDTLLDFAEEIIMNCDVQVFAAQHMPWVETFVCITDPGITEKRDLQLPYETSSRLIRGHVLKTLLKYMMDGNFHFVISSLFENLNYSKVILKQMSLLPFNDDVESIGAQTKSKLFAAIDTWNKDIMTQRYKKNPSDQISKGSPPTDHKELHRSLLTSKDEIESSSDQTKSNLPLNRSTDSGVLCYQRTPLDHVKQLPSTDFDEVQIQILLDLLSQLNNTLSNDPVSNPSVTLLVLLIQIHSQYQKKILLALNKLHDSFRMKNIEQSSLKNVSRSQFEDLDLD